MKGEATKSTDIVVQTACVYFQQSIDHLTCQVVFQIITPFTLRLLLDEYMTLMVLMSCTATGNVFSCSLFFYNTLLTLFAPERNNSYQESNIMNCIILT